MYSRTRVLLVLLTFGLLLLTVSSMELLTNAKRRSSMYSRMRVLLVLLTCGLVLLTVSSMELLTIQILPTASKARTGFR
jgi:hypothetical protein